MFAGLFCFCCGCCSCCFRLLGLRMVFVTGLDVAVDCLAEGLLCLW